MFSKRWKPDGQPRPPFVKVEGCDVPRKVRDTRGRLLPGIRMMGGGRYAVAGWEGE